MHVTIHGRGRSDEDILEQLREVKEDVVISLCFNLVNFYGPSVLATIDIFRRVARLGRQMTLTMESCCSGLMGVIIKEAFAGDSLLDITLYAMDKEQEHPTIVSALSYGMRFRHLQSVHIIHRSISREQVEYLGDGLVTAAASNSNLKCLRLWNINFQDEAMSALVSGLRQNSTLQIVNVENCGVTDAPVSRIAEALQSNPSLRDLKFLDEYLDRTVCCVQGMKVLVKLVSKNCKLETLTLVLNGTRISPSRLLVKSFEGYPCLKYLELSHASLFGADLQNLVEVLPTCPQLETLNLIRNKPTHDRLEMLASQPLPCALRRLCLCGNDIYNEKRSRLILRLLQDNPQLWVYHRLSCRGKAHTWRRDTTLHEFE